MDSFMTDKEMQDTINKNIRLIAYSIFGNKGDYKFVKAYQKLKSRVLLDHRIHINNRIKDSGDENTNMFTLLHGNELELVLQSSKNLLKLYGEVLDRQAS